MAEQVADPAPLVEPDAVLGEEVEPVVKGRQVPRLLYPQPRHLGEGEVGEPGAVELEEIPLPKEHQVVLKGEQGGEGGVLQR